MAIKGAGAGEGGEVVTMASVWTKEIAKDGAHTSNESLASASVMAPSKYLHADVKAGRAAQEYSV